MADADPIAPDKAPQAAPDGEALPEPDLRDLTSGPRNIVLFSDGTGNSSAKLQKTNVWRLYEALDLGYPVKTGLPVQIAFYDNGVGTSAFRLLAILGGVFGFGLARNVRTIYLFLCRNYRPGDRIYLFGFSRGAFTVRLLTALIGTVGVLRNLGEEELQIAVRDIWREYRRFAHLNNRYSDFLYRMGQGLARAVIRLKRRLLGEPASYIRRERDVGWYAEWRSYWKDHDPSGGAGALSIEPNLVPHAHNANDGAAPSDAPQVSFPDIEFVGVWDTVAAYGGPIVEITRGIDEWIWPITMTDYRLPDRVKRARHALAIDDKRDSFHPLLWDEVEEKDLERDWAPGGTRAAQATPELADVMDLRFNTPGNPRLQQVWFAGMHSDVGGGYADESLAYVSLWWMIEHAEARAPEDCAECDAWEALPPERREGRPNHDPRRHGLRLLPEFRERIETFRNVYGPLHDSRGGSGAFYRYQPRMIEAWVDWTSMPDPAQAGGAPVKPATQTMRDPTIARGTHAARGLLVAPVRLHISVEERLRMATDGYAPNNLTDAYVVDDGVRGVLPAHKPVALSDARNAALEVRIKLRRFWYFLTMATLALLASKPFWGGWWVLDGLSGNVDDRVNSQAIEATLSSVMPSFAGLWVHSYATDPLISLALFGLVMLTMAIGVSHERGMADVARGMWKYAFAGREPPPLPAYSWFNDPFYRLAGVFAFNDRLQQALATWKWRLMPRLVGFAMWLTMIWAALFSLVQVMLLGQESWHDRCSVYSTGNVVRAGEVCHTLVDAVAPDRDYRIEIRVRQPWRDGGLLADPDGWQVMSDPDAIHTFAFDPWVPALVMQAVPDGLRDGTAAWTARRVHNAGRYFRRVSRAPLMAPILELRGRPFFFGLFRRNYILIPHLEQSSDASGTWVGTFHTPREGARVYPIEPTRPGESPLGSVAIFLNDAEFPIDRAGRDKPWPVPFRLAGRYDNNEGSYEVTITPADPG